MTRSSHGPSRRQFLATLSAGSAGAALGTPFAARAESYLSRPLRWLVGYPAGAASDFIARTVASGLSSQLGQSIIIDNKGGASGILAGGDLAKAAGDGYTLMTADNGICVYNTALFKKLPYDPAKDFAPIGLMCRIPVLIAANPQAPFADARALIAAIKAKPDTISYASGGVGTPHNLAMEMLKDRQGLQAQAIQYRGGAPAVTDVLGGQVPLILIDAATGTPFFKTGKLKPLGTFTKGGIPGMPGVQSFVDLGYTDIEATIWQGVVVPRSTPAPIRARLSEELQKTLKTPAIATKLQDYGVTVATSSPEEMQRLWESDAKYWVQLIHDRKLTVDQ